MHSARLVGLAFHNVAHGSNVAGGIAHVLAVLFVFNHAAGGGLGHHHIR